MERITALWLAGLGLLGALSARAPVPAALVAGAVVGLLLAARASRLRVALGGLVFVLSGVRAHGAIEDYRRAHGVAQAQLSGVERCVADVKVESSPTLQSAGTDARFLFLGTSANVECSGQRYPSAVRLRLAAPAASAPLARGDHLELVLQLGAVQLFRNPGPLDPRPSAARQGAVLSGSVVAILRQERAQGPMAWIDRARHHVRTRILASYRAEVVPLARALVLGENDLDEQEAVAFSKSGLMHILAVSGTHLVIAVLGLERGLFALLVRIQILAGRFDVARASGLLGTLLAFAYADFAGGSGSARRAAYMLAFVLGGRAFGFRVAGAAALGASILLGLAIDPLAAFDISFLLSALATLGLLVGANPVTRWLSVNTAWPGPVRSAAEAMVMTLSASLFCGPLLALLGGTMTPAALVANLIAGPAGEMLALPACLLHALVSFWPGLERGLAIIGGGALYVVRAAALVSASIESLAFRVPLPTAFGLARLGLLGLLVVVLRQSWARQSWARQSGAGPSAVSPCWAAAWRNEGAVRAFGPRVALLLGALGVSFWLEGRQTLRAGKGELRITALDVGQGDALLLEFPDGRVGLMDGGGYPEARPDVGGRVLLPVLRARGIEQLDLLLLSHPDRDHLLGLLKVVDEMPVREFWHSGQPGEDSKALARLLVNLERQGTVVKTAGALCGTSSDYGATLRVLAPCGAALKLGRNDASLVLRIDHGRRSALLTGDIEEPGELLLARERGPELEVDLLKVAHHGSITSSSPSLLARVRPRLAFISVGVRNTFDHPSPVVLGRFGGLGARIFRTDLSGALSFWTNGEEARVSTFENLRLADDGQAPNSGETLFVGSRDRLTLGGEPLVPQPIVGKNDREREEHDEQGRLEAAHHQR